MASLRHCGWSISVPPSQNGLVMASHVSPLELVLPLSSTWSPPGEGFLYARSR